MYPRVFKLVYFLILIIDVFFKHFSENIFFACMFSSHYSCLKSLVYLQGRLPALSDIQKETDIIQHSTSLFFDSNNISLFLNTLLRFRKAFFVIPICLSLKHVQDICIFYFLDFGVSNSYFVSWDFLLNDKYIFFLLRISLVVLYRANLMSSVTVPALSCACLSKLVICIYNVAKIMVANNYYLPHCKS